MPEITLRDLTKRFGGEAVIDGLSARIDDGELFVIVGPTGCGKTTLLRLVAGVIRPDAGQIFFDRTPMDDVPARDRGVRFVFQGQHHALYPHMPVFDEAGRSSNLGFPLQMRGIVGAGMRRTVEGIAQRLGIPHSLFARKPDQLSQGQKQSVAVGRAITVTPRVFLLDEPLSNLDPITRAQAREEIRRLHRELQTTTLYVTHDLAEAFQLADRMAILHEGAFAQLGPPETIRRAPASPFVADFVGTYVASVRDALGR